MTPPLKVKRSKAQKDQLNLVRNGQPHVAPALKSVSEPDSELHAVQLACASTTEKLVKTQHEVHHKDMHSSLSQQEAGLEF